MIKPRIKLAAKPAVLPIFQGMKWRCFGPSPDGIGYGVGYGSTPRQAYWNWQNDLTVNY